MLFINIYRTSIFWGGSFVKPEETEEDKSECKRVYLSYFLFITQVSLSDNISVCLFKKIYFKTLGGAEEESGTDNR